MFDIKAHRPVSKITVYMHTCDKCKQTVPSFKKEESCSSCEGTLSFVGSWWFKGRYTNANHIETFKKEHGESDLALFMKDIVLDYGDLVDGDEEFRYDMEMLITKYYDIALLMMSYCQMRALFGLPDLGNYSKNLNGQSRGNSSTTGTKNSRRTARTASRSTG